MLANMHPQLLLIVLALSLIDQLQRQWQCLSLQQLQRLQQYLLYTTGITITVRTVAAPAPVRVQANQTRAVAVQTVLIKDLKSQVMATEYPKAAINVNR